MFNLKKIKAQVVTEKYLRKNPLGPQADDDQLIAEKTMPDRKGDLYTTTEAQFEHEYGKDAEIIEKVLNNAKEWRSAEDGLAVPPINTVVARLENERREVFKTQKDSHWSQTFDEKKQQGSLPKLKKNAPQHDKIVLNNDPRRFESERPKELVGGLTTADIDRVVAAIKTGETLEYDAAILAILKEADKEERELTSVEQKAVADLKIARTNAVIKI